jgi:hypothetical protein
LGGGAAPAPPPAGSGRSCDPSIQVPKKNARYPGLPELIRPEGLAGMAGLRPLVPGGGGKTVNEYLGLIEWAENGPRGTPPP